MAYTTRVIQNVVAALVRKSEPCSGDVADYDDHRIGHRMARVVFNGSGNGERLWRLCRCSLFSAAGDEKQRNKQTQDVWEFWRSIHFFF